ncbi:SDR family NAD(P)-dependent oxidoreductase [Mycobacterium sp.]|uniref:SDR family NAD(P)-dependent oxidoreductase n=1 Tax=Mycobacterium sp. TaxID=1785 RepID=UPI003C78B9D5
MKRVRRRFCRRAGRRGSRRVAWRASRGPPASHPQTCRGSRATITVRTDVASPDDCDQLVDATTCAFGKVDILVNNAERLCVSRITFSGECAPSATDRYSGSG